MEQSTDDLLGGPVCHLGERGWEAWSTVREAYWQYVRACAEDLILEHRCAVDAAADALLRGAILHRTQVAATVRATRRRGGSRRSAEARAAVELRQLEKFLLTPSEIEEYFGDVKAAHGGGAADDGTG